MINMGMQIMEQLLLVSFMTYFFFFTCLIHTDTVHKKGIGGRVPRSFSGPLVDVLYKIIGKYIQPSRQWLSSLLANVS